MEEQELVLGARKTINYRLMLVFKGSANSNAVTYCFTDPKALLFGDFSCLLVASPRGRLSRFLAHILAIPIFLPIFPTPV